MNRSTLILVVTALVGVGGAWSMRPKPLPPAAYEDTGEPLFKEFTDPTLATFLEVVTWDEESAEVVRFSVEQKEGKWVIPSHNDYPADGTERMGKAAASFIDVKKDLYYGDNAADHAKFGVLDPDGAEGKGDERGKRITIKDAAGTLLVDVIVGKEVESKQGMLYVRYPGEKRVYASKLEINISTSFTDWIEKDLLRVERDEIVQVVYDPYKVDEEQGKVLGREPIIANVAEGDKEEWTVDAATKVPEGKVVDSMKIKQIATAVANVKIVGVRPRPELNEMPVQMAVGILQPKGFFVSMGQEGPQLFGNEGQVSVATKDGIVYTLLFGEVTYESGLALTAGGEEGKEGKAPPDEEKKKEEDKKEGEDAGAEGEEAKTANRYMFVNVSYDPSRDKSSAIEEEPEEPAEGEEKKDEPPKLKGPQRAEQLSKRFGSWFYVISDSSFKQIHKERDEMFKDAPKDEKKDAPGEEEGLPELPSEVPPGFP
jgi:hypothetical protein